MDSERYLSGSVQQHTHTHEKKWLLKGDAAGAAGGRGTERSAKQTESDMIHIYFYV